MRTGFRSPAIRMLLPPLLAIFLVSLFIIGLVLARTALPASASFRSVENVDAQPALIQARRAISIPYGIDSPYLLMQNGTSVQGTGHGACPEGGEYYQLWLTIDQGRARAAGRTEIPCDWTSWSVEAVTHGPQALQPGAAQACAMVVIHFDQEGAITYRWCKDILLTE